MSNTLKARQSGKTCVVVSMHFEAVVLFFPENNCLKPWHGDQSMRVTPDNHAESIFVIISSGF